MAGLTTAFHHQQQARPAESPPQPRPRPPPPATHHHPTTSVGRGPWRARNQSPPRPQRHSAAGMGPIPRASPTLHHYYHHRHHHHPVPHPTPPRLAQRPPCASPHWRHTREGTPGVLGETLRPRPCAQAQQPVGSCLVHPTLHLTVGWERVCQVAFRQHPLRLRRHCRCRCHRHCCCHHPHPHHLHHH